MNFDNVINESKFLRHRESSVKQIDRTLIERQTDRMGWVKVNNITKQKIVYNITMADIAKK